MPPSAQLLYDRIFDMDEYLHSLIREKQILQGIENEKPDFGDLLIAYELVSKKIDEVRHELRDKMFPVFEEEEEEEVDLFSKYNIEHLIEGKDGSVRKAVPSDFDMDKNPYVLSAFRVLLDWYINRDEGKGKGGYG